MFGPLGFWEIIFILGLALLIFGPRRLPEMGRTLGRGMAEFRKATTDLKRSIQVELDEEERRGKSQATPASDRALEAPEIRPRSDQEATARTTSKADEAAAGS